MGQLSMTQQFWAKFVITDFFLIKGEQSFNSSKNVTQLKKNITNALLPDQTTLFFS